MERWNHPPPKSTGGRIDFSKPNAFGALTTPGVRERWHETAVHLSWFDVLRTAKEQRLSELVGAVNENIGKFVFATINDDPDVLTDQDKVWALHGLKVGTERKSERRTLYPVKGKKRAFATYAIVHGFNGPEVDFYFPHRGRKQAPEAKMSIPWKSLTACLTTKGRSPELNKVLEEWAS